MPWSNQTGGGGPWGGGGNNGGPWGRDPADRAADRLAAVAVAAGAVLRISKTSFVAGRTA